MTSEVSRTFKLTLAYDGTGFAGWQIQPGRASVQGSLEDALGSICGEPVKVIGSGRTDAGVHALAQVASCRLSSWRATAEELARAVNTRLPREVVVIAATEVDPEFHALRDAIGKRYRFQLGIGGRRDPFSRRYRWHLRGPLDVPAMRRAAERLVGRHDFAAFQASGSDRKTTVRTIRDCRWVERGGSRRDPYAAFGRRLDFEIEADGFLYNMVRNITGTLVEIGRGKRAPGWIDELIAAGDRTAAGPTAPPHGLFLQQVDYPP